MREQWKDIEGFPGYQVSTSGRIRSKKRTGTSRVYEKDSWHYILPQVGNNGRTHVGLYKGEGKVTRNISRLVAETFIPNPNNLPIVRHLNDVPYDNRVENLAWGTYSDNIEDARRNGSLESRSTRIHLRITNINTGEVFHRVGFSEACKELGVNPGNAQFVMKGLRRHTKGYKFEKLNEEEWENDRREVLGGKR